MTTLPRISPGTPAQLGVINTLITRALGRVTRSAPPNVFTTLARHRGLFRRWLFFASGLLPFGRLPRADTELVILRVAHNTGCDYEWHHHERVARRAGLTPGQIARVRQGAIHELASGWTPRQHALLVAVDDLSTQGVVSDAAWSGLAQFLDEQDLIEFCLLAGHYHMLAMTLKSLGVQVETPRRRIG